MLHHASSAEGPAAQAAGRMAARDAGAGIAGTQAPSLLLWQWELEMQKAAHPSEGAGTGRDGQHRTHLRVHGAGFAAWDPGRCKSCPKHPGQAPKCSLGSLTLNLGGTWVQQAKEWGDAPSCLHPLDLICLHVCWSDVYRVGAHSSHDTWALSASKAHIGREHPSSVHRG